MAKRGGGPLPVDVEDRVPALYALVNERLETLSGGPRWSTERGSTEEGR